MANATADIAVNNSNKYLDYAKWFSIPVCILGILMFRMNLGNPLVASYFYFFSLFIFVWIHGSQRYGFKNMLVWFICAWVVSNFWEWLSIHTGFPFGNYHYNMPGPRVFDVPFAVMVAYFGLAYISWTTAQAVTGTFNKPLAGLYKFVIPFTTALVMTMHDVVDDPVAATINGTWIWEDGGAFFGVPISNFAGWVFVVWCFMQIFALYMSNKKLDFSKNNITSRKRYWFEAVGVYLFVGLGFVLQGFAHTDHVEIYSSMAMLSVFTMVFVALIALLNITKTKDFN